MTTIPAKTKFRFPPASPLAAGVVAGTAALVIVVVTEIYWRNFGGLGVYLDGNRDDIFLRGQLWRLFTCTLVHADQDHLFHNLFPMVLFGFALARNYGWLAFPILPFLVAPLFNLFVFLTFVTDTTTVGASGVVYFMGAFWATMFCFTRDDLPRKTKIFFCGGALLLYVVMPPIDPRVSQRTHVIGAIFGFACATLYYTRRRGRALPG